MRSSRAQGAEVGQGGLKQLNFAVARFVLARSCAPTGPERYALTAGCTAAAASSKDGNSMRRPASSWRIVLLCVMVASAGCHPTQPFYLHEDGDLSHYLDKATQVEHPDLDCPPLADVE